MILTAIPPTGIGNRGSNAFEMVKRSHLTSFGLRPHADRRAPQCRINSLEMAETLIACAKDASAPWPSRIAAAVRAWGKPKEHLQLDGEGAALLRIQFVDIGDVTTVTIQAPAPTVASETTIKASFGSRTILLQTMMTILCSSLSTTSNERAEDR